MNDKSGKPYFIEFSSSSVTKTSVNEDQLFRDILQISPDYRMLKTQSGELFSKFSDDKFQMFHKDIKVEFATYTLH